jgi:hypothetical protein
LFAVNIFMEQHIAEEVALAASEDDFAALAANIDARAISGNHAGSQSNWCWPTAEWHGGF